MGATYAVAVSTPPVITSLAWFPWYTKLLNYRIAECPIARATTYYFSQSGNDTTGDGSQATPWKTLAKAQAIHDAAGTNANLALLFKRGDVWKNESRTYTGTITSSPAIGASTVAVGSFTSLNAKPYVGYSITLSNGTNSASYTITAVSGNTLTVTPTIAHSGYNSLTWTDTSGLAITKNNVTVGNYGTGTAKSLFSAFQGSITSASTATTRADTYRKTMSTPIARTVAYFREVGDKEKIWRRVSSIAEVDATPGSWWQDTAGGVLYFHDFDDSMLTSQNSGSQNFRTYEYVVRNSIIGIYINDVDGTRIDGVRVDGYGAKGDGYISDASYGIKGNISGTNACVISNAECYINDNHALGILGPAGAGGGIITYYRCRAGWLTNSDSPFVSFAQYGGHEIIAHECECPGQVVPQAGISPQPVPYVNHSTSVTYTYTVGGNTLTVSGNSAAWASAGFRVGQSYTLTGGTSETLTCTTYNPATGVATFGTNIANTGHTGISYASGRGTGKSMQYGASLVVLYGNRNVPGMYQVLAPWHQSVQNTTPFYDLADCRIFSVGEVFRARNRAPQDIDRRTLSLVSASQSTNMVTLASAYPGSTANVQGLWATLTGGTSPAESMEVQSISGTTVTFYGTIQGASRSEITLDVSADPYSNNVYCGFGGAFMTIVNGSYEISYLKRPNTSSPQILNNPETSYAVWLNCAFLVDGTQTGYGATKAAMQTTSGTGAGADFYNCRFHAKMAGKDVFSWDFASVNGTGSVHRVYNSLFTGDTNTETGSKIQAGFGNGYPALSNTYSGTNTSFLNNAYGGITTKTSPVGYDNDPFAVEISNIPSFGNPSSTSALLTANNQRVLGQYTLEYDAQKNRRSASTPAVGTLEPMPLDADTQTTVQAALAAQGYTGARAATLDYLTAINTATGRIPQSPASTSDVQVTVPAPIVNLPSQTLTTVERTAIAQATRIEIDANSAKLGFSPAEIVARVNAFAILTTGQAYQDSAKTTPVTALGQPLGWIADKSGNGSHAFQDVTGKRMTYATSGTNGLPCFHIDGTAAALRFTQSTALDYGTRKGPVTVAMAFAGGQGTFGTLIARGGPASSRYYFTREKGGVGNFTTFSSLSALADRVVDPGNLPSLFVYTWEPLVDSQSLGIETIWINGVFQNRRIGISSPGRANPNPANEWRVGESSDGSYPLQYADIFEVMILSGVPASMDAVFDQFAVYQCLDSVVDGTGGYGIGTRVPADTVINIITDGDSITQGTTDVANSWQPYAQAGKAGRRDWLQRARWCNPAIYGQQVSALNAAYSTRQSYLVKKGAKNIYVLFAGTNDLFGGRTAQQAYDDNVAVLAKAKADGCVTVLVPVLPRGAVNDAVQQQKVADLRTKFAAGMAQSTPIADVYCHEVTEDTVMGTWGNQANTTYYDSSAVHPTDPAGALYLAGLIMPGLDRAVRILGTTAIAAADELISRNEFQNLSAAAVTGDGATRERLSPTTVRDRLPRPDGKILQRDTSKDSNNKQTIDVSVVNN